MGIRKLKKEASALGIKGYGSMNKGELEAHIALQKGLITDQAAPTKACPKCGVEGGIDKLFGYRKVGNKTYPQSQCRKCRSKRKKKEKGK